MSSPLKLTSWNVNGIRSVLGKGFLDFVAADNPDILCLQEVKAMPDQVELTLPGYSIFWNSAVKKGYSGTAILTRKAPLEVTNGMGLPEHDNEGRVITAEFEDFFLVNVYTPNSKRELERLPYRQQWDLLFLRHLQKLEEKKPVVFCGDLNVAHTEIDLANPSTNRRNAGFTDEERAGFTRFVEAGFVDTFRHFNKEGGNYTWWSYMNQARPRNIGWRIDYFCISDILKKQLQSAAIAPHVLGSDHCPVSIHLAS